MLQGPDDFVHLSVPTTSEPFDRVWLREDITLGQRAQGFSLSIHAQQAAGPGSLVKTSKLDLLPSSKAAYLCGRFDLKTGIGGQWDFSCTQTHRIAREGVQQYECDDCAGASDAGVGMASGLAGNSRVCQ